MTDEPQKINELNDDDLGEVTGGTWTQKDEDLWRRNYNFLFYDPDERIYKDWEEEYGTREPTFEMWMQRMHPNAWRRRTEAGWE